ncbi:peroxisome biogenesis protein 5 [Dioscorea cayenensis subsp. rotundata]|uniref:Peroxisome biogenesis protein 5 n=1 Tax=Dioscorea cayennensis subsp. rotundata TaxID=55577 RepID=A0AB40AP54_DIOCR|nr:peroxisome biogenesis protein 5 [Dioscorea cayenensis subsp. rotundata]
MAMRDLVTGEPSCAVPGSSSSNPLGALASRILGSSSKTQDLKGLPGTSVTVPDGARTEAPLTTIPGSEYEGEQYQPPNLQSSEFLRDFHATGHGDLAGAWDEIQRPAILPHVPGRGIEPYIAEFEQIYDRGASSFPQPILEGPPQRVLSSFLHSFLESSRTGVPFRPAPLPMLGLSEGDKQCIRDRSCIMARHIFADKSEEYITAQVNALLHSLDIDSDHRVRGPIRGAYPELEEYWTESQGSIKPGMPHLADKWISEFSQQREDNNPESWANSFEQAHGANGWASEFEREQAQMTMFGQAGGANMANMAAMEQSRMLAHTLAQNTDPKFQNSKFLQFVSKMSRGELIVDENQIKPIAGDVSGGWADEFQTQHGAHPSTWAGEFQTEYNANSNTWANQFEREGLANGANKWANEFASERVLRGGDEWVNEFSNLRIEDWGEEFEQQFSGGVAGEWADSFDNFMNEQRKQSDTSRGIYEFSDMNPYVGRPNPLKDGQDLFRKGLLSEAVLALEAEVLKNPENAEGWRLLGITHAENDDDQQAIASMMRAQQVDPANLEVLLALGVSYTNELEREEALNYLYKWLQNHPKYGSLAPAELANSLYYGDIIRLFNEAAQLAPEDADVHIVLGVLYNLTRDYDKAITAFETALKLKPRDYSLWNKLGATQANSSLGTDAIYAYQQALDLKPNYVRAWANMGISYANQGMYLESIQYYVRALAMNPKAETAWQYLRTSLDLASRHDMFSACDSRNLELLQKEFPL